MLPGLGEAFDGISARNYAKRLAKEYDLNTDPEIKYFVKEEKFEYTTDSTTHCLSIFSQKNGKEILEYILYDFGYSSVLCGEFKKKNVLQQSFFLFFIILSKISIVIKRLFKASGSGFRSQRLRFFSFYTFTILLILATGGILLIPATLILIEEVLELQSSFFITAPFYVFMKGILLAIASVVLAAIAIVPSVKEKISSLSTEFACAHYYLAFGERRQALMGQLNSLLQFIAEVQGNKEPISVQFHCYSFGSIIGMDFLFPYGDKPAKQTLDLVDGIFTIGCPFEYISAYYPNYFDERYTNTGNSITWFNIFCSVDALSSNFRNDNLDEPPSFSYSNGVPMPINKKYELANIKNANIFNFLALYPLRAHQFYWSKDLMGTSCINIVFDVLQERGWATQNNVSIESEMKIEDGLRLPNNSTSISGSIE